MNKFSLQEVAMLHPAMLHRTVIATRPAFAVRIKEELIKMLAQMASRR